MRQKVLKRYLDEVCDMLDTYGGRDKVSFNMNVEEKNQKKKEKEVFFNLNRMSMRLLVIACNLQNSMFEHV